MTVNEGEFLDRIAELEKKIETLESRYERAIQRTEQMYDLTKSRFARIPDSALFSESYLKRAFAVYGHVFVAGLIIGSGLLIVEVIFELLF